MSAPGRAARWLPRAAVGILLVLTVAAVATPLILRTRRRQLEERLRERVERAHAGIERLTHVERAAPGRAGDAILAALLALRPALGPLLPRGAEAGCVEVARGDRPWAVLPEACKSVLAAAQPALREALLATHAGSAGGPRGFAIGSSRSEPLQAEPRLASQAGLLAALDVRQQLDRGEVAAAISTCLDGLALGRDLSHGTSTALVGVGLSVQSRLLHACAAAVEAASPAERRSALGGLQAIRAGMPGGADVVRDGSADELLQLLGGPIPSPWWSRTRLVQRALLDAVLLRVWRQAGQLAPLADGPRPARQRLIDESIEQGKAGVLSVDVIGLFGTALDRLDDARARLDVLIAAAAVQVHRDREGSWPASLSDLRPRAVGAGVTLELKDGSIELGAPLLDGERRRFVLAVGRTGSEPE